MQPLPIDAHLGAACALLRERRALVLVAEPGAGKTTRLPPAIAEDVVAPGQQVWVLEPRRVAARAAARRVAAERGGGVGQYAGYHVRFERRAGPRTRVLFLTEGLLARRLQADPALEGVGAVVLDEFHERSLDADLALALLAEVRASLRPDLCLVVTSATLEAEPVAEFLDGAPVLRVEGRNHALEVEHAERRDDRPLAQRVAAGVGRALARVEGDVLVFLPGVGEIRASARALEPLAARLQLDLLPLHGEQSAADQDRALAPGPRRRVVLATNVAETSLTVPGVRAVVDAGLARVASHDPASGLDRLELRPISHASATQRAGRAGREAPGLALRLWTAAEATRMPERLAPEVRRVDLAPAALALHAFGERRLDAFGWFEAPEPAALARAEELLARLGAIAREDGAITALGRELAAVPAHPRIARMLREAARSGVVERGALLAALVSEPDPLRDDAWAAGLPTGPSDLLARADLIERGARALDPRGVRAVERVARQLERTARRAFGGPATESGEASGRAVEERLLRVVLAGYPDRVARRRHPGAAEALMVGGRGVELSPASVVRDEELFCVLDPRAAGARANARARRVSTVRRAWLEEAGALREETVAEWDAARERVVGARRVLYEDLVLEEVEVGEVDPQLAREAVLERARVDPLGALRPGEGVRRLLARLRALSQWCPELELPFATDAELVDAVAPWCDAPRGLADLRRAPLLDALRAALSRAQQLALEREAPERLTLPTGEPRRLEYEPGRPPVLAARVQELFGLRETPRVAGGRVAVIVHLLAPNGRVVQVTQDLASFWDSTYAQVRRDLRGRYPKHAWPEDPHGAAPTARARRRGQGPDGGSVRPEHGRP